MKAQNKEVIHRLLGSKEPSVKFKVLTGVLGKNLESSEIKALQDQIKSSPRAKLLLSQRDKAGKIPYNPYAKWYGAHWVLTDLADIGYPPGDETLIPLREQVYDWLFSKKHEKKIKSVSGRVRRCASQEGNALFYLLALGLADSRTDELAERLSKWQWPDGGWNCDKKPDAINSSFFESLIPLRGLALHARLTGNMNSKEAAKHAAEIFLKRKIYKTQKDGSIIMDDFVKLHYPCYWHYDILFGLKVLAEVGFIYDERCHDALNILESKRLPDGGFPAEKKYYRLAKEKVTGRSLVDWGGASKKHLNEFVTADSLFVLSKSGRLN
ncbi:MAG: hypothetical protein JSV56_07050 [Methanomassiliicoccales archaeon]|nr:MAG: hypothetical protein JSV56_07050 [Methanomassiliicoccales archaeon]